MDPTAVQDMLPGSRLLAFAAIAVSLHAPAAEAVSTSLPSKSEVLAVTNRVAEDARQRFSARTDATWDHGVYHIGMMSLYDATHAGEALKYTQAFGDYNNWTLERGGNSNLHNRLAAGQSWIDASAFSSRADITDTRSEVSAQSAASLATVTSNAYFAVDAQFMALPAFAMLGKRDHEDRYFRRLYELFDYNKTTLGLYDATAHLYYRDASYIYPAKQTPNGKKVLWSRGNGWALAALARILADLPATDPARAEYVTTFRQLSAAVKAVQRSDGLWNMSLADPAQYPGPEVSGTALFVYGMAWGINNGLLSAKSYAPIVAKGWNGMVAVAVHPDGKLGYVQNIGQQPVPTRNVTYESTADFGVGVFLLAGTEVAKLAVDGNKYEAESALATVSYADRQELVRDVWASAGQYSRGVFGAVNDYIQYSAWLPAPGTYNVKVRYGKGSDLGRWRLAASGVNLGSQQDAYSEDFTFAEANLGNVTYQASGKKAFRFTVTGRNSASSGYATAIDYVMLTPL